MSIKHRPRSHSPQAADLEITSSFKTYTFDENSLRMALVFLIVFRYWRADFALFFSLFDV